MAGEPMSQGQSPGPCPKQTWPRDSPSCVGLLARRVNERTADFVSARVRDYEFHPYWGFIADQAWLG
jgi:hypothetical protein